MRLDSLVALEMRLDSLVALEMRLDSLVALPSLQSSNIIQPNKWKTPQILDERAEGQQQTLLRAKLHHLYLFATNCELIMASL